MIGRGHPMVMVLAVIGHIATPRSGKTEGPAPALLRLGWLAQLARIGLGAVMMHRLALLRL
jgi:hypothetical protein